MRSNITLCRSILEMFCHLGDLNQVPLLVSQHFVDVLSWSTE